MRSVSLGPESAPSGSPGVKRTSAGSGSERSDPLPADVLLTPGDPEGALSGPRLTDRMRTAQGAGAKRLVVELPDSQSYVTGDFTIPRGVTLVLRARNRQRPM